jgi:hypothetical protein
MISDRMTILAPERRPEEAPSTAEVLATTRGALTDCSLAEAEISSYGDTLHWRDSEHPPGLHVMVRRAGADVRVTLAQDLYGPVGPTDAYQCVRKSLRRRLEERFGKERVRQES